MTEFATSDGPATAASEAPLRDTPNMKGLAGFLFGVVYLRNGRNLALPIIAHGLGDTIDFLLIFSGKYPTLLVRIIVTADKR